MKNADFLRKCLIYREFTPPVFHTELADYEQREILDFVFDTLAKCEVPFFVVDESRNGLIVHCYGLISESEALEVVDEVADMYSGLDIEIAIDGYTHEV